MRRLAEAVLALQLLANTLVHPSVRTFDEGRHPTLVANMEAEDVAATHLGVTKRIVTIAVVVVAAAAEVAVVMSLAMRIAAIVVVSTRTTVALTDTAAVRIDMPVAEKNVVVVVVAVAAAAVAIMSARVVLHTKAVPVMPPLPQLMIAILLQLIPLADVEAVVVEELAENVIAATTIAKRGIADAKYRVIWYMCV